MNWILYPYLALVLVTFARYVWHRIDDNIRMHEDQHLINGLLISVLWPFMLLTLLIIIPLALLQDWRKKNEQPK